MTSLEQYRTEDDWQQNRPYTNSGSSEYTATETAQEYFRAARTIKNSSINETLLIGDFLVAVEKEVYQGEEGTIEEFLQSLSV